MSLLGQEDGEVKQGSFTPAEATLKYTIDVGGDYDHILVWMADATNALNNGHKTLAEAFGEISTGTVYIINTNNAGTAPAGLHGIAATMAAITKDGTEVTFESMTDVGNVFGYFEAVQYNWAAW